MILFVNLVLFILSTIVSGGQLKCGQQLASEFIVGGEDAHPGEFPWQVQLGGISHCGGTLVRDYWILTAAHCLETTNPDNYTASLGLTYIDDFEKYQIKVVKVIPHPNYTYSGDETNGTFSIHADIGLIRIEHGVLNSSGMSAINTICLVKPDHINLTNDCWITGFGHHSNNHSENPYKNWTLKKLDDWVTDNKHCIKLVPDFDPSEQLCVGGWPQSGRGACGGDSGSALQCRATDGLFYQIGITSYGTADGMCGVANAPDVYTKVSAYTEWIDKVIAEN